VEKGVKSTTLYTIRIVSKQLYTTNSINDVQIKYQTNSNSAVKL